MSSVLKDSWQPQNKQNKPSPWDASGLQQHFLWVSSPVSGLCVPDQELSRGVNKSHAFPANSSPINIPRAMFWNGKMNWNIHIFINPNKPQAMLTGKVKHPKFLPAKHLDVSEVEKFPIQFFFFHAWTFLQMWAFTTSKNIPFFNYKYTVRSNDNKEKLSKDVWRKSL